MINTYKHIFKVKWVEAEGDLELLELGQFDEIIEYEIEIEIYLPFIFNVKSDELKIDFNLNQKIRMEFQKLRGIAENHLESILEFTENHKNLFLRYNSDGEEFAGGIERTFDIERMAFICEVELTFARNLIGAKDF